MKKTMVLIGMILALLLTLCACGDNGDAKEKETTKSTAVAESGSEDKDEAQTENKDEDNNDNSSSEDDTSDYEEDDNTDLSAYKDPGKAVKIDFTRDDPSNDNIEFLFDDDGRVKDCVYKVGDITVYAAYTYSDNTANIYAFTEDGTVLAAKTVELSNYDPDKGFALIDGYYFKGYTAK